MHTNLNLSILLRQLMFTKWKFLVITYSNRKTRIPLYIRIHKIPVCLKRNFLKHEQTRIQNMHSEYLLYFIHSLWWEGTSHSCSLTMRQWSELSPVGMLVADCWGRGRETGCFRFVRQETSCAVVVWKKHSWLPCYRKVKMIPYDTYTHTSMRIFIACVYVWWLRLAVN